MLLKTNKLDFKLSEYLVTILSLVEMKREGEGCKISHFLACVYFHTLSGFFHAQIFIVLGKT